MLNNFVVNFDNLPLKMTFNILPSANMGKVSSANKMRIQTLREQGYGVKVIMAA